MTTDIITETTENESGSFLSGQTPAREFPSVETLRDAIVDAIQDRKGTGITIIDLSNLETANAQSFIICEGRTPTQVSAIADSVREKVQADTGQKPFNYDGYRNSTWIVIDYGSVMVHIFVPDARNFYDIEQLWCDGVITNVADID
ncbi:MAG: ribosome silencing factor [Prevotella sp.]|nr:ribosome silencing factor [Prevotella sp.]MCM1074962.1 ribosome silencing factor [Ruminococcus sp.]